VADIVGILVPFLERDCTDQGVWGATVTHRWQAREVFVTRFVLRLLIQYFKYY
jgi:hypothetical protein